MMKTFNPPGLLQAPPPCFGPLATSPQELDVWNCQLERLPFFLGDASAGNIFSCIHATCESPKRCRTVGQLEIQGTILSTNHLQNMFQHFWGQKLMISRP